MKKYFKYYYYTALILLGIKKKPDASKYTHATYPELFIVTEEALNHELYLSQRALTEEEINKRNNKYIVESIKASGLKNDREKL